eukprot:TRINITY_DN1259_c1_g2_i2.p1 TRINITY_DN1259_c1_g2~~TRINITY_DN1259_c1_g2_i2.p1  ORF type:complete len:402 (-),score=88.17 TRINITY_DN1259_c1_g2_i2:253-1458(-)
MVAQSATRGKGKRGRPAQRGRPSTRETSRDRDTSATRGNGASKKARGSPPEGGRKNQGDTHDGGAKKGASSSADEGSGSAADEAGDGDVHASDSSSSSEDGRVHKSPIAEPITALNHFLKERHTNKHCSQGLIVWAKVEGFSWWPALIVPTPMIADSEKDNETHILVNFFATDAKNSFGYVLPHKCVPFHDYYERFSRGPSANKKKKATVNLHKAVEAALEMQTSLGRHVTEELKHLNPVYEVDGSLPRNACYCVYCFDGGNLALCDHCPASLHLGCVSLGEDVISEDMNFYCPPCTGYHLHLALEKAAEVYKDNKLKPVTQALRSLSKLLTTANYRTYHAFLSDATTVMKPHYQQNPDFKSELQALQQQVEWCVDQVFRASDDDDEASGAGASKTETKQE